jgi:hypothetical protein
MPRAATRRPGRPQPSGLFAFPRSLYVEQIKQHQLLTTRYLLCHVRKSTGRVNNTTKAHLKTLVTNRHPAAPDCACETQASRADGSADGHSKSAVLFSHVRRLSRASSILHPCHPHIRRPASRFHGSLKTLIKWSLPLGSICWIKAQSPVLLSDAVHAPIVLSCRT